MTSDVSHVRIPQWTLGDRLRKARQMTGMTTREFAKEIGISQVSLTKAENDSVNPRRVTLLAYAFKTGVPLEWLETGKAPVQPEPDGGLDAPSGEEAHSEGLEPPTCWLVAA